jgi:hypothetical protein
MNEKKTGIKEPDQSAQYTSEIIYPKRFFTDNDNLSAVIPHGTQFLQV